MNPDSLPFVKEDIERSIPERFEKIVQKYAHCLAIKDEDLNLTYSELNEYANRVAHAILRSNLPQDIPIPLLFNHNIAAVAAILGVLKAGKAYVALDPDLPLARISAILEDVRPALLLTDSRHLALAGNLAPDNRKILDIDALEDRFPSKNPGLRIPPETLMGIFYTSGTTGRPKGVARNHRFVLHRIWFETNNHLISPQDRFSQIHDFSFGASLVDAFNAILNGAALCLFDIKKMGIVPLIPWLNQEKITFFHVPTDLFRQILGLLEEQDKFPMLRQVTPSGKLYKKDVEQFRKHVSPQCVIVQRLASTETGIVSQFRVTQDTILTSNVVPVGYAVEDKEILILGETGEPVEFNEVGEIAVRSKYLASGYWRQPELTAQTFLPDRNYRDQKIYRLGDLGKMRPDGCLELLGRTDAQVKIRGFRVEIGEVEAALLDLDFIDEAIVLTRAHEEQEKRLVAYLVASDRSKVNVSALRMALQQRLPDYMIPSAFVFLDQFPQTERNKIDLRALPDPGRARPNLDAPYSPPRTPTETVLTQIWKEVLEIEPIGIHDSFFELGGNSLLAARTVSRINAALQSEIPLRALFDTPTIVSLATAIDDHSIRKPVREPHELKEALKLLGYG